MRAFGWKIAFAMALATAPVWADVTTTPLDGPGSTSSSGAGTGISGASGGSSAAAPTSITPEQAQALVASGQYREALKVLLRLLDMKGAATAPGHSGLLLLRGECQLQVHENASASDSLQAAAKEATTTGNVDEASKALALLTLIQKSPGDKYVPILGTSHTGLNILDQAERKQAYSSLLADGLALDQQKLRTATSSVTVTPILDTAKGFTNLRAVEKVATGVTKQCDDFGKEAAKTAAKLMGTTLTDYEQKLSRISTSADQVVRDSVNGAYTRFHHSGLTSEEVQMLRDMVEACQKIPDAVTVLNQAFGQPDDLARVTSRANSIKDRANAALHKDYRLP